MKFGRLAAFAFMPVYALLLAPVASAQEDPRFVTHKYKVNEVVKLHGRLGVQATITFEEGEQIENVAVGDSQKWQVAPNKRANLLFVKPLEAAAVTNMTVVTNRRTYLFDLVATAREQAVYMFQFTYGDRLLDRAVSAPAIAGQDAPVSPPGPASASTQTPVPVMRSAVDEAISRQPASEVRPVNTAGASIDQAASPAGQPVINFGWGRSGDASLFPVRIYDDGEATFLTLSTPQAVPAILIADAAGIQTQATFAMRGDTVVIDSVPSAIVLRNGTVSATLENLRLKRLTAPPVAAAPPRTRVRRGNFCPAPAS